MELVFLKQDLQKVHLYNRCLTSDPSKPIELSLQEISILFEAGLVDEIPSLAKQLDEDPRLHPIAKTMLRGDTVSEEDLKALVRAGAGG